MRAALGLQLCLRDITHRSTNYGRLVRYSCHDHINPIRPLRDSGCMRIYATGRHPVRDLVIPFDSDAKLSEAVR